jgi:hypothetical protein
VNFLAELDVFSRKGCLNLSASASKKSFAALASARSLYNYLA